jgi:hypothetical protein
MFVIGATRHAGRLSQGWHLGAQNALVLEAMISATIYILEDVLKAAHHDWTSSSVLKFAAGRDPVQAVVQTAREIVLGAIDKGWVGPPFDPTKLAELLGLSIARAATFGTPEPYPPPTIDS